MLSSEDFKEILNPNKEEFGEVTKEFSESLNKKDYSHAIEMIDKGYNPMFDTPLVYARFISELRKMLQEGRLEEMSKETIHKYFENVRKARELIGKLMNFTIMRYQGITENIKKLQELQQKYGLTNAPKG